jgi:hypothetical protein
VTPSESIILHELEQRRNVRQHDKGTPKFLWTEASVVPWLDALQKQRALQILEAAAANQMELVDEDSACISRRTAVFEIPVMHEETFYSIPQQRASGSVAPLDLSVYRKQTDASKSIILIHCSSCPFST